MFIVKCKDLFWTGRGFSEEYPEAKQYKTVNSAILAADLANKKANEKTKVFENYGFDNENTVYTSGE